MKILLISGHGAGDPGAMATVNGTLYREAEETRKLTARLAAVLAPCYDVTVYPVDRNAYSDYQAGFLRTTAKFSQYDYVLEIHFNALQSGAADGATKGVEIYVTASEAGTAVEEKIVHNISALGLRNRGVKRNNFAVIRTARAAGVPAALLEVCFIDDPDDMAVYTANREGVVQAIANGIREGFGLAAAADEISAAKQTIKEKAGLSDKTIAYLADYQFGEDLLKKLAAAMK